MNIVSLDIEDFLIKSREYPIIDVRSEAEYTNGHIPNAHNISLFNNQERAEIGTIYKQIGKEEAILRGLEIVGTKMVDFVRKSREVAVKKTILIHCWRGGMRSGSFAWLLKTAGLEAFTLQGGYKSYRNLVLQNFEKPAKLLILGGETGSGKTEILKVLKQKGEQVIDLEALAHHKGSAFGAMGEKPQPSPEQFENNLAQVWNELYFERRIWLEDESYSIGKVHLPEVLWRKMKLAPILRIMLPFKIRIERLVSEYGKYPKEELTTAIQKIQKKIGGLGFKQAIEALKENNLALTAEIALTYYDKTYQFNHQKRNFENVFFVDTETGNPEENAQKILDFVETKVLGNVLY